MHYVGNRAIILGDGRESIQLTYNPGFTALSVLLPIVFLFVGLTLSEVLVASKTGVWTFLILGGFIVGLSITGMHYIGNLGISNYRLRNPPAYIVGAATIAVCASICALTLFSYLKAKWVDRWPRRLACALLLTCTVSGMHWVATIGTTYTLIHASVSNGNRDVNLIVAIICVSAFPSSL
jgi:NO-binding membrane sensor protein with MHYT domain